MSAQAYLSWLGIVRLGLVQTALGSVVVLTTSTLNRVMVVELALPALVPALLVGWHYGIQLSRPRWGHGSDRGSRRTPWIIGGMGALALGGVVAADAVAVMQSSLLLGGIIAVLAFGLIGIGVGAAGTSLLALLATRTAPERRPAAAALAWIMMVLGIAVTAGVAGHFLDPFSFGRLVMTAAGITLFAFLLTLFAVAGVEGATGVAPTARLAPVAFSQALKETLSDPQARMFAVFVFVAMLAYSAQDLILEPFAGLIFGMTPGQSTQLGGMQHGGVLVGMIAAGALGGRLGGAGAMRSWIAVGCIGSAVALAGLAAAAAVGPGWPLEVTVFALGLFNGIFAVSAIGAMMTLAGQNGGGREGIRLGVWGAAQAVAFGLGNLVGAAGVDLGRRVIGTDGTAFMVVFAVEAALFVIATAIAILIGASARPGPVPTETDHVPA